MEDSTPGPASIRLRSTCSRVLGDQLHDSEDTDDKNEDIAPALGIRSHDLPEWLEEFTEHLVDEKSALRDTSASMIFGLSAR